MSKRKNGTSADIAEVKRCLICNRPLSRYNDSSCCFSHTYEEREQAGLNLKSSESSRAQNTNDTSSARQIKAQAIIKLVHEVYNVPLSEVRSANRLGNIGEARRVTAYLLSEDLDLGLSEIGQHVDRNPKSVRISVSLIKNLMAGGNSPICEKIKTIRSRYPQNLS